MAGKLIGLGLVLMLMKWLIPQVASAADGDPAPVITVDAVNTAWTLIAAFLVFGMQVGFVMLEAGFARERESVNILVEGIADTCICGVLFWAIGFAFMFEPGTGLIGTHGFLLQGLPATYGTTGVPLLAFWVFQFAFADTASTITSGAMVGRCGFIGDLLYSVGVTGFIYPIVGHWAWGPDGWLALRGFHDFAGSTVVHTIGGTISLAGALALGPRLGRVFRRDGGGPMPPHNLVLGAVGGLILWFGWYGFNPGSTLSALDVQGIGRVSFNTTLAACSAGLTALFISYARTRKWDLGLTVNGFLGGLVAITCPCYWVSPTGAFFIGIVAAPVVIYGLDLLEHLRIDDPIGAVPVHMFAGIWGTLSLGLFATGEFGLPTALGADTTSTVKGLLYGGGVEQLVKQAYGVGLVALSVFAVSCA
jgi:Amt family ammonium transporter